MNLNLEILYVLCGGVARRWMFEQSFNWGQDCVLYDFKFLKMVITFETFRFVNCGAWAFVLFLRQHLLGLLACFSLCLTVVYARV